MNSILAVFIGGGLGSLVRFGISKLVISGFEKINPISTLISNLISTAILAFVLFLIIKNQPSDFMKLFFITGFCGGFSTFSTFSFELFELLKNGFIWYAIFYLLTSVVFGVGLIYLISKLS
jgi:CrcB protein